MNKLKIILIFLTCTMLAVSCSSRNSTNTSMEEEPSIVIGVLI